MAVQASAVYEVNSAVGNTNNPGGYDGVAYPGGTDKSQGAVVQIYTDLVIDGADNTKITSAARAFISSDVGNSLRVTGGTGFTAVTTPYYITSVVSGAAFLDRAVGTVGSTGGLARFGGALAHPVNYLNMTSNVAGTGFYVKDVANYEYVPDGVNPLNFASVGTDRFYRWMEGYSTVRGDGGQCHFTTAFDRGQMGQGGDFWIWKNVDVDATNTSRGIDGSGTSWLFENVSHHGGNTGAAWHGFRGYFRNCRFHDVTGGSPSFTAQSQGGNPNQGVFYDCCEFDSSADGIVVGDGGFHVFHNCLIHDNTNDGVRLEGRFGASFINCTIADNGRDGIRISSADGNQFFHGIMIHRCLFGYNAGYQLKASAVDMSTSTQWAKAGLHGNAFYTTGSGVYSQFPAGADDLTLTADPFADHTNADYTINNSAGGGALLQSDTGTAVGFVNTTSYVHRGGVEAPAAAAPISPSGLIATAIDANDVQLTWTDNSTNENSFGIERKVGAGSFVIIDTVSADVTDYLDITAQPNTTYTYRVFAANAAGNSGYTNEAVVTTPPAANTDLDAPEIDEVQLPVDISEGAVFGPTFSTLVIEGSTGVERRIPQWEVGRYKGDVSHAQHERTDMLELIAFWLARNGKARGFRFKDWSDFEATDEPIIADGSPFVQLIKTYTSGGVSYVRNIFKPQENQVAVTLRKNTTDYPGFTVDTTTGIVTLDPELDENITDISQQSQAVVTVASHSFTDGMVLYISGVAGMDEINGLTATLLSHTSTLLTLNIDSSGFNSYAGGGVIAKYVQPSDLLDWSGEFDVPVRFDTDEMKLIAPSSEVRDWNDIPIIELLGG